VTERVLGLDVSTKTGWSFILSEDKDFTLEAYGKIGKIAEPNEAYPGSYVTWAYLCFSKIVELIELYKPDILVIEETSGGSKSAYSQKILEFIHFLIAKYIKEIGIKVIYYQTETWRRIVGCVMSKAEKDNNKKIKAVRKNNPDIKVVKNENGKRIGRIGRKHINVRRANELLGKFLKEPLILANEDAADALLLGLSYHIKKVENVDKR
jgi:hypothetical protein